MRCPALPGWPRGMEWGEKLKRDGSAVLVWCCLNLWRRRIRRLVWVRLSANTVTVRTMRPPATAYPVKRRAPSDRGRSALGRHRYQLRPALCPRLIWAPSLPHTPKPCGSLLPTSSVHLPVGRTPLSLRCTLAVGRGREEQSNLPCGPPARFSAFEPRLSPFEIQPAQNSNHTLYFVREHHGRNLHNTVLLRPHNLEQRVGA